MCWHGPEWLTTPEIWPTDEVNEPSEAIFAEAKHVRKVLNAAVNDEDDIQRVFNRFQLQKAIRIGALMQSFAHNLLRGRRTRRIVGPFTTEKT